MREFVSVIIPCRNESAFLGACLDSVLAADYPRERMEVVVADGMSEDGTRELIERYTARDARVRRVDNPQRITPVALNRAVAASRGEIILRLDAHAEMAPHHISRAVDYLRSSAADNVGGGIETVARDRGPFAEPIRMVLAHRFGVGNSHFRTGAAAPRWVDTVFGGCWRREVFDRLGGFNEKLVRGQDLEFNLRLRNSGGRILLAPDLETRYYARATLPSFWRHNWSNGVWVLLAFAFSEVMPVRLRHLAPLAFVCALGLGTAAVGFAHWILPAIALPYLALNLGASTQAAWRERNWKLLFLLPVTFLSLHVPYGAGSLWGALQAAAIAFRKLLPERAQ